jgi:hypothetical protein
MFVPGVNGSIIANSNAPTGSRLKGAYKNSKKRKMPNGGSTGFGMAVEAASYIPGPIGMYASGASAASNIAQGDYMGAGLDALNIVTGGTAKGLMGVARVANRIRPYSNLAIGAAQASRTVNRVNNTIKPITRVAGTVNEFSVNNNNTMRVPQRDNAQVVMRPNPNRPIMPNGGLTSLTPKEETEFQKFYKTLPSNLQSDTSQYDIRGYWDSLKRPIGFDYSQLKEDDGLYHAYSRHPQTGKMLKAMDHPTASMAIRGDKAAGYSHAMDPSGNVYSFSPNDLPTAGPFKVQQNTPTYPLTRMDNGGWSGWTPIVDKPYMRTSPAGNAGYSDNTKVSTPDLANRKAAEAAQYARKVGSVTQGKVKSDYEKAREATSFVSQAEQRKGSADPLDHVLDMVNPASLAFAATDLVGNTGSAVSNVAQGNFAEAGSDLLNAGMNALQVIPAAKAIKPFGSSILKGVSKYADDVVQTSKIAGKPALPTYKNVYRTEHANFNKAATPNDLTGRWALDDLRGSEFYVNNLKTPQGEGFVTKNYFKGEVEPVRMMRDRLPEYKMKQQFAEGMPEEARIMSMGKGKLTDQEFASVLGDGAIDRMRTGKLTEMDYNTMSTAPFMYNTSEGILNANRVNQLRQGENTFLGRGKTSLFPDQKKAIDYIKDQSEGQKNASSFSKYLPFSTYERGGKIDHSDDKDMVNGVASILRRVESKPNRLKLANQLSKQFDREKVKYDLTSFLAKSKVKK